MKILVSDSIDSSAVERMRASGLDVTVNTGLSPEDLIKTIPDFDVLAIRSNTRATKAVIEAGTNLKLIVRAGVGLDNVDAEAAARRNITVRNTPGATVVSVAEHAFAMLLSITRSIPQAHAKLARGEWDKKSFMGVELLGKTIGIVGFGRIGREVARRAKAFGMNVIAFDPALEPAFIREQGAEPSGLDQLLEKCDIITLHLPLTDDTADLFNAERFAKMKDGAYLINCARGGIVDETAAAHALRSGKLAGAAFDVFAEEPIKTSPLMNLPNVVLTPHLGATTREGQRRAGMELAEIVVEFAKNHR